MADAFIYDAVRTPRGKGRKDGSLHEVTPVRLAVTALQAIRDRNKLDTHLVDDVILGCVMPIGEQGADIARTAGRRRLRRDGVGRAGQPSAPRA
jgi:acetyl-CoA C-acetyltransferase